MRRCLMWACLWTGIAADALSVATTTTIDGKSATSETSSSETSTGTPLSGANSINSAVVVPVIVASVSIFVAFLLIICLRIPIPVRAPDNHFREDASTLRSARSEPRFGWLHRKQNSRPTIWPHTVYNGGDFETGKCGELEMRVVDEMPRFPGQRQDVSSPSGRGAVNLQSEAQMEEEAEARIREMLERMNPEDRAWASEELIYGQAGERDLNIGTAL